MFRELVVLLCLCAPIWSQIIWQEEFDWLDEARWQSLVTAWRGGNNEFQYYRNDRRNSYVRDGILYVIPTLTADEFGEDFLYNGVLDLNSQGCNIDWENGCMAYAGDEIINPVQSARLRTMYSYSFHYGRVEIRAQMPRGDWLWPAIWMLPTSEVYGAWPRSGEIDILEARGNENLYAGSTPEGIQVAASTMHWGPDEFHNGMQITHWEKVLPGGGTLADDFHIYGMEWTENHIQFTLDGQEIGAVYPPPGGFWELGNFGQNPGGGNTWGGGGLMAPFDQDFHFIVNVAVGGLYFPDGWTNSPNPKPWDGSSPHPMRDFWEKRDWWLGTWNLGTEQPAMKVDYIRVYAL